MTDVNELLLAANRGDRKAAAKLLETIETTDPGARARDG